MKKFYLVSAHRFGWDEFDSMLVVAENKEQAISFVSQGDGSVFEEYQKLTAKEIKPSDFDLGDRPICSYNAG